MKNIRLSIILFLLLGGIFSTMFSSSYSKELQGHLIKGADISTLYEIEVHGGKYYQDGVEKDLLEILKDNGFNWIRLRLWVDPDNKGGGNCDLERTLAIAKRAKDKGFKFLLDFHYSDWWADPGKQEIPEAWENLSFEELKLAVYEYTKDVITILKNEGALPDMVQIGNEIRSGILWPYGKTWAAAGEEVGGFEGLATLLNSGIQGVKDSLSKDEEVLIMLHTDQGGDNGAARWLFDGIIGQGVEFDIIGLSYYPYWHGTIDDLKYNMKDITQRYDKDVIIAEFAYAWTLENGDNHLNIFGEEQARIAGFPASVEGQKQAINAVMEAVNQVPNGRGVGVFYWEPAWIPVEGVGWKTGEGNAWDNQTLFDFGGNALDSLKYFGMWEK